MLNIEFLEQENYKMSEYDKRIQKLEQLGFQTNHIIDTVNESIHNINEGYNSFVIYGEPQCGKTELMIALTAKLLDEGHKLIIVLLNDDTDLLSQNIQRFRNSSINPSPINYTELLGENVGTRKWIIFCKKNINDLKKINDLVDRISGKIVIDDEGDYASPNGSVNKDKKTKINEQIEKLLEFNGIYIGVTATPARLDLNNTFDNLTEKWVKFLPHDQYAGKEVFFPVDVNSNLEYSLKKLPDTGDKPEFIRKAIANFIVNVSLVNIRSKEDKYCFLIHTSGEVNDHSEDKKNVLKYLDALIDKDNPNYKKYWTEIIDIAALKASTDSEHKNVVQYAYSNITNRSVTVLNSKDKSSSVAVTTNNPPSLYSIFIGGNKVSRGITFGNLLGMFFTRDAVKIQQDTYIQRARMFGNRKKYIKYFELWITESLYYDWHRCFVYHYLSLKAIESNGSAPVWIGDSRIRPVSPRSIDKRTIVQDKGEMAFAIFDYETSIDSIFDDNDKMKILKQLYEILGNDAFPPYVYDFIKTNSKIPARDINILQPRYINNTDDKEYVEQLFRQRGTFGGRDIDKNALHNLLIVHNSYGKARLIYYYSGKVEFFKKSRINHG